MEVKNCRECGRLFNYIGGQRLCPACREALEDKFNKVKTYIRENHSAQLNEIAEANDISVQQIKQWIREERLTFTEDSAVGIECESCGKMIRTGRYCEECKKNLANTLGGLIKKEPEEVRKQRRDGNRMRFLDGLGR